MKKHLFIIVLIGLLGLLIGCSKKTQINAPYEIMYDNNILSYFDQKQNVPPVFNIIESDYAKHYLYPNNDVFIDSDGKIRLISITSSDVTTYHQISVGDDIDKIENNYLYEDKMVETYYVLFDGIIEINPNDNDVKDDYINILYSTDGSKITRITIYDVKYGTNLK